ncbi:uroporphyrinogen-III C-methyltransferase [Neobacillus dielmonensis]|uniref:uroporphyrinogen-III C-methyltransferase n=1 Tax=Neobacillus dielmonensis TaxID=1347369 RepID=UPI0005A74362|nr:uroporphyrinogen-III C-methyltransferase [Neobacillus dielmonensis]
MKPGKVFLVGAGPGDIGLITVKGLEAIRQAEVILYDRLANPRLLEYAPPECELIYCGKLPDRHTLRQERINELLVEKALDGKIVVRLKGGDPGVFGRVGEEAAALAESGITYEMVPGISSGIAAPLYAGIPVTHREHAESFAVVTAHDKSQDGRPVLDWEGLARGVDTIAFYMGVKNLPFICENLIKYGKPSDTPVILIQWGTFGRQKTLQGTLTDITEKVLAAKFSNPSIILVGKVVSLREKISWFEKKPLSGRQILLARTGTHSSELAKELTNQGADVIEFPKWTSISVPVDQELIEKLPTYQKVLFTSPESVDEFFHALRSFKVDIRQLTAVVYGFSKKTLNALEARGFIPQLAAEMPENGRFLIVGDDITLQGYKGANADLWVIHQKQIDPQYESIFKRMLGEAQVDTVVFPSRASVELFLEGLKGFKVTTEEILQNAQVVSMGMQTLEAVVSAGLPSNGMPDQPTKDALVQFLSRGES